MTFNRWYMPGDIGKETMPTEWVSQEEPDFKGRYIMGGEWGEWNGYGGLYTPGGQVWCYLVPPEEYFAGHPEYYALVNGERIACSPHEGQLCTTNPEVAHIFARAVVRQMNEDPNLIVPISPNDNDDFCECDKCRRLYPTSLADRLMAFYNQVARLVARKHPDRHMTFLAYSTYTEPPRYEQPDPHLIPQIARIGRYFYGISEEHLERIVRGWCAVSPTVSTYEYVGHWSWYGFLPTWRELARDFRLYKREGVDIVCSETHPHWATQGFNLWAAQMLASDTDLSINELLNDYCEGMFHGAGDIMRVFYDALDEEAWRLHVGSPGDFFTPGLIEAMEARLNLAKALVSNDKVALERVLLVKNGFDFTRHWAAGFRWQDRWYRDGDPVYLRYAVAEWKAARKVVEDVGKVGFQMELIVERLNRLIDKANNARKQ